MSVIMEKERTDHHLIRTWSTKGRLADKQNLCVLGMAYWNDADILNGYADR